MINRNFHGLMFCVVIVVSALVATGSRAQVNLQPIFEVAIEKDVAYLPADRAEKADLYLPAAVIDEQRAAKIGKRPGMIIIHGGGWTGGDKGAAREINIGTTLAGQGYVCMSINYMLQPKEGPRIWPSQSA